MLFPHRPGAESADPEQQPSLPPARGELQAADGQQPVQCGRHGRHQGQQARAWLRVKLMEFFTVIRLSSLN